MLYKVEGSDAVFFYNYGSIDTLQFVKVDAEIAADKYLGYKHLTDEECAARVYSFNYLHGLNMDTYLNVPEGKDSIVRVDEKGGKAWFQLEKVVKEDSYGSQAAITGVANWFVMYIESKFVMHRSWIKITCICVMILI